MLIHLIDISSSETSSHIKTTEAVLGNWANENPSLIVFNKIDKLESSEKRERFELLYPEAIFISAETGEGLELLKSRISESLNAKLRPTKLMIPHDRYDVISQLHASSGVRHSKSEEDGVHIEVCSHQAYRGLSNRSWYNNAYSVSRQRAPPLVPSRRN